MAQQIKVFATRPDDLSLNLAPTRQKRETPKICSLIPTCMSWYDHPYSQINNVICKKFSSTGNLVILALVLVICMIMVGSLRFDVESEEKMITGDWR